MNPTVIFWIMIECIQDSVKQYKAGGRGKKSVSSFDIVWMTWWSKANLGSTAIVLGAVHIWRQPKMEGSRPPLPPLSAKVRNWSTPPPPLVRKNQKPAYPPSPPCQKSDFDVSIFLKENTLLYKRYAYEKYLHIWKVRKSKKNTSLD